MKVSILQQPSLKLVFLLHLSSPLAQTIAQLVYLPRLIFLSPQVSLLLSLTIIQFVFIIPMAFLLLQALLISHPFLRLSLILVQVPLNLFFYLKVSHQQAVLPEKVSIARSSALIEQVYLQQALPLHRLIL